MITPTLYHVFEDHMSTIKRGYWFGPIPGNSNCASHISVVSVSPSNFSCCETSNGFYNFSPISVVHTDLVLLEVRSCKEGYTLSFDFVECITINNCTIGHTVVVILSMMYWVAIIILVYIMTYIP